MSHWAVKYQSLYTYLTNWCDYTHTQAKAEVQRRMADDGIA